MKKLFPIVAFIAVALISMTMAGFAYFATQEAARIKFDATADDALNRIESRIDLHLSLLRSMQALFDARNGDISGSEFTAFFKALDVDNNFAGLRGIGYLRLAKAGDEAAVERDMLRDHGVSHPIYPDTTQPWRAPVMLFEPLDPSNQSSIGYDMFSEPVRRAAIEKAMSDDHQHASGLLQLGHDTGAAQTFTGFLVFVRLNIETAPDVINASRSSTAGFLYAAFRARDLFQTALSRSPLLPVNTEIYDGDGAVNGDNLLFRSETPPASTFGDRLLVTRKIMVAGRPWTVLFRPTSAFSQPSSRAIPVMLGLFGLLLAGAIALVARYQERAYEAASRLHETTEKSLLEKDLMLQEMKHRIKNSITRVLAIARQTASRATDVNEFSASFSARLQAMAASQDMLTRSRWQKADLGDLLRIELGQVFGKELPEGLLSGPQVLLDETTTQALGLTFHELATNALKYGEAGNSVGALKVDWSLEGRDRTLTLNWREAGQTKLEAPAKTGFGTKLIDLNVTRELRGTIKRDFRANGLNVEIRIPLAN